jgi:ankyrin repeat protein
MKDNDGMVPLHYACVSSATNYLEIVATLLDANEDSINIEDNQGRTPLQVLKGTASHLEGKTMLPLYHLAASSECLTEKSLLLVLNANPESIHTLDINGMLPFHHACQNEAVSVQVLMLFLSLYPEAVKCVNKNVI